MSRRKRPQRSARASLTPAARSTAAARDVLGRLHLLVLHRDPVTGGEQAALRAPLFREAWQNELTVGAANTARATLREAPSLERTVELARSVMAATSRLGDALLARAAFGTVACRAGCDHCCYQSVGVTPPEALALFEHLQETRSSAELEVLAARVAERARETRALSSAERFSPEQPCAFLEQGQCSVYEARPLSCRGMNSLDAEECRSRLRDPEARTAFLTQGSAGRSFMEPIRAAHAVSAGLQLGLSELYGLDMRPLELTAALDLLLNGPQASAADWLNGKPAFEAALGGDHAVAELCGVLQSAHTPAK